MSLLAIQLLGYFIDHTSGLVLAAICRRNSLSRYAPSPRSNLQNIRQQATWNFLMDVR
ncbi:hypothetical protein FB556_1822 [Enteractinococcus coprophilus]|uniref:Uncharacterized protein n=1 Tax=Enteractinococcus coprophilus TaxID=1027633 RepID=A0A543AFI7_9MICC|nr:hypothetical protein FB556_1822 [Enteractinococcus coprophilus]